ncbi:MAG: TlpA disulfide reductase family protein [Rhodoferax sp.]|uniref:TlpA family protein disulfide reductase n=1 Tax=Rhodoferax sp. TaxID=50421 RepID=UPI002ACE0107|nr:TlpA disulfide reductase family protein [Rhodoferax sp.]MDZ7893297.1 TlpA disulfide reductase family protein [Rhodoferax sp.]
MATSASAQTAPASPVVPAEAAALSKGSALQIPASFADGKRFSASALQGTVTVAFFWNTDCAVCRDSLPELRANLNGWRNKPFSLLLVNLDRKANDWQTYEKLVSQTQMTAKGLISVRMEGELPTGTRLPLTLLIDNKGQILQRFEGRLAPEVWDSVAELLP